MTKGSARSRLLILGALLLLLGPVSQPAVPAPLNGPPSLGPSEEVTTYAGLGSTGLSATASEAGFVRNDGQIEPPDVMYYASTSSGWVGFLEGEVILELLDGSSDDPAPSLERPPPMDLQASRESLPLQRGCCLRIVFEGSSCVHPKAKGRISGSVNYLIGQDRSAWMTNVPRFSEIIYEDLYKGIDLVYRLQGDRLKYEYVIHPGADPSAIRSHVEGQTALKMLDGGTLEISTTSGPLYDTGLTASYMDGAAETLPCEFRIAGAGTYGFNLGRRDESRTLIIDPVVFSTYLGGSDKDSVYDVASDGKMDVYITGSTKSPDFPTTPGVFQTNSSGNLDIFVRKLSSDGRGLVYSTYIGGKWNDMALAIDVDDEGGAIVTGWTTSTSDFPQTPGAVLHPRGHCFLCRLNPAGTNLTLSTRFGGNSSYREEGEGLAIGPDGDIFITGETQSWDFPTTPGAYRASSSTMGSVPSVFTIRMKGDGSSFVYSTLIGAGQWLRPSAIAVDAAGDAYLTGGVSDEELYRFPTTFGAYQPWSAGGTEAYVCKLNPEGSDLVFSTLLGSSREDLGTDIALDGDGNVYVTGLAGWGTFPSTAGSFQPLYGGGESDGFLCKLDPDGSTLLYGTFIGGDGADQSMGLGLGKGGEVYVAGWTDSGDLPTSPDAFQTDPGGEKDAFLCKLDLTDSSLVYSSYLGGSGDDTGEALAVSRSEVAYVAGTTASADFPTTSGAMNVTGGRETDGFLVKLDTDEEAPIAEAGEDIVIDQHQDAAFDGTRSTDNVGIVSWRWEFEYEGVDVSLSGERVNYSFHAAGSFTARLTVADELGHLSTDTVAITVRDVTLPATDAGADMEIEQGQAVEFDGSASTDNVGIVNWTWRFVLEGNDVTLYGPTPKFTFEPAGLFPVILVVSDAAGNVASDALNVTVQDITPPIADAGEDSVIGQHEMATLDGTGSSDNVGIANWTWAFMDGGSSIALYGATPSYTFDRPGIYSLSLVVTDMRGNRGGDVVSVTVRDTTPPIARAGPDRTLDPHTLVEFDATGSEDNIAIIRWTFTFDYGGMTVHLNGPTPRFTFDLLGTFLVTLSVQDAAGNHGTDVLSVTVRDVSAPVAAAGPDRTVGQHQQVVLDGTGSSDNVGIAGWVWTVSTGGAQPGLTGPLVRISFAEVGVYTIVLNVSDSSGNWATDESVVTVTDVTPPVAEAGADQDIDLGERVTLNGNGSRDNEGVVNWTWRFEHLGTEIVLNGSLPTFAFEEPGDYLVILTVTDRDGNNASDIMHVRVKAPQTTQREVSPWLLFTIVAVLILLVMAWTYMRGRMSSIKEH